MDPNTDTQLDSVLLEGYGKIIQGGGALPKIQKTGLDKSTRIKALNTIMDTYKEEEQENLEAGMLPQPNKPNELDTPINKQRPDTPRPSKAEMQARISKSLGDTTMVSGFPIENGGIEPIKQQNIDLASILEDKETELSVLRQDRNAMEGEMKLLERHVRELQEEIKDMKTKHSQEVECLKRDMKHNEGALLAFQKLKEMELNKNESQMKQMRSEYDKVATVAVHQAQKLKSYNVKQSELVSQREALFRASGEMMAGVVRQLEENMTELHRLHMKQSN